MIRHPDGSVTVTYRFEVTRARYGCKRLAPAEPQHQEANPPAPLRPVIDASSIPKLTRLLVLGHHLERLVREGVVHDYTQLARMVGITKGRITHLVNLTLLPPDVQQEILLLDKADVPKGSLIEGNLRLITQRCDWNEQRAAWTRSRR